MDLVAMYLSLDATKRAVRSAMPTAEVVPPSGWERLSAAVRARFRPPEPRPVEIVRPYEVGVDAAADRRG